MKILYKHWTSNIIGTVGLVITENEMGVRKLRCSFLLLNGMEEDRDAKMVADYGSTIPKEELELILEILNGKQL